MKRFLFALAFLLCHSLSGQTPGIGSAAPTQPSIKDSYDFRRFLVGSTWTWCWGRDGSRGSEIKFTADGKVKHDAFTAKYTVRSRSEVELVWDGRVAKLRFDPVTYARYTGDDFNNARPIYGAPRPAGTAASIEEVTTAAFANASEAGAPAKTGSVTPPAPTPTPPTAPTATATGRTTFFGNTGASLPPPASGKNPAVEQDLKVLTAQHTAAVSFLNKGFQADLAPLLKRAEQTGDAALVLRIKSLMTAPDPGPDDSTRQLGGKP